MAMHPWSEANIAAAQRDVARIVECLEQAVTSGVPHCWSDLGIALARARMALSQLDGAVRIEAMSVEMAVTAGDDQ